MKEKRYFYDSMMSSSKEPTKKEKVLSILSFLITFFVIVPIISIVLYNITMDKYSHELNGYSYSKFERLEEIANIVIKEGHSFDLAAIPQDVSTYDITYEDSQIKFKYYLMNSDLVYAPSTCMTITLSEDLQILEKTSVYEYEEIYIRQTKSSMLFLSIIDAFFILIIIGILAVILMIIGMFISYFHKKRNQKVLSEK